MEESKIYNLLESELLQKWIEEIEKMESEAWVHARERNALEKLETELSEKSKDLLRTYVSAIEGRIEQLNYNLRIKILNFGIKIGIDLNNAFNDFDEV